jgi:TonB family protein
MMFEQREQPGRGPWNRGFSFSVGMHAVALFVLLYRPAVFVRPQLVVHGDRGKSTIIYLAPRAAKETVAEAQPRLQRAKLTAPVMATQKPIEDQTPRKEVQSPDRTTQADSARAGTAYGSVSEGEISGAEVRPALPLVFPDPPRSDIPPGVQGDVIVEVTIDAAGQVVETRLLKSLGFGIDEKVIAVLQRRRYRPATRDGMPIPSKQDVHFHFPS